ncbi:MAG: 50S ribosomal protein L13 [Nanoarchaeota archaeon]
MILDAKNLIIGRFASVVAKRALLGEEIIILNSDLAVFTGKKEDILRKYKAQANRGEPFHGPFLPKRPHLLLKRIIRGMIPYKRERGRQAFKRVKCYISIPEEFKDKKLETIEKADITKRHNLRYMNLQELCSLLKHAVY